VTVAGGLSGWVCLEVRTPRSPGQSSPLVVGDGPTFRQALGEVNSTVVREAGGPWSLFSVYGIASELPFSANVIGYSDDSRTINSCSYAFPGITLWNGSIPTFNGTFNSGTAPFWQFGFLSSSSSQVLVATNILGTPRVFLPVPFLGRCWPWYDMYNLETAANWTALGANLPVDSSVAATSAWESNILPGQQLGRYIDRSGPYVEIMTTGPGVFEGLGDRPNSTWGISFDRCGEVGITGWEPLVVAATTSSGAWYGTANLTENCAIMYSGHGSLDGEYDFIFGSTTTSTNASTTQLATGFQLMVAFPNGTPTRGQGWGLANWMLGLTLTQSSGAGLTLGGSTCPSWTSSVARCPANSSGWFAVLLSSNGEWVDSYGLLWNGSVGWSVPAEELTSNQTLAVVVPATWVTAGDVLVPVCRVSSSLIEGSLSL